MLWTVASLPLFLSTLSLRRATVVHALKLANTMLFLSTLSLRRATSQLPAGTTRTTYFYPRSPCGERPCNGYCIQRSGYFYPRSPCGERRTVHSSMCTKRRFLSTLSLRRATRPPAPPKARVLYFYPRSPCGERHANLGCHRSDHDFYPRSPCGERHMIHLV